MYSFFRQYAQTQLKQKEIICIKMRKNSTNIFLKDCMADALLRLLKKKPLEQITITEITNTANVGRVTFYRNFTSKEELLDYRLTSLILIWWSDTGQYLKNDAWNMAAGIFRFIADIRDIIQILTDAGLFYMVSDSFYKVIGPKNKEDQTELYRGAYHSFGLCAIASVWVSTGMRETPEELADIVTSSAFQQQIPADFSQKPAGYEL